MSVLQIIMCSLTLLCVIFSISFVIYYFPRLIGWFKGTKKQKRVFNDKKNKIAVIIPARNESMVIGKLFESLKNQTYPEEYFDSYVIIKDENDKTNEISKSFGANVFVVPEKINKSYDIDKLLKTILKDNPNKYDAYLILDADCMMDKFCLEEMNNALSTGAQVIQAKKLIKNYLIGGKKSSSIWSKCNGLIWSMIDEIGNKHKTERGATIMTVGTGVLLRSDVVQEIGGFPYKETLTEDIEFMYDCVLRRFKTMYYQYAKIYAEEATSHEMTNKRRTRWMNGVVNSTRIYKPKLEKMQKTKNVKRDIYYTTCITKTYSFIGMWTIFGLFNLLTSVVFICCGISEWKLALILAGTSLSVIYLSFFLLTLSSLIADWKNTKISFWEKILVLFFHPFFYMEYITIVAKALISSKPQVWEVIERVNAINQDSSVENNINKN